MEPSEARIAVLRLLRQKKINQSWLADQVGEHKQSLNQWLSGKTLPRDPTVWLRLARVLGVGISLPNELTSDLNQFLLDVVVESENPQLRAKAAMFIKEIQKNYS